MLAGDGRTLPWTVLHRAVRPYALAVNLATTVSVWSVSTDRAVERVRKLHTVCTETPVEDGGCAPDDCDEPVCVYGDEKWPCATILALDGDDDE